MFNEDVEVFQNGGECGKSQTAKLNDDSLLCCVKGVPENTEHWIFS